jgi:simple sugar transport system ATP-binding protein
VGDRFVLLKRGQMMGSYLKSQTSLEQLTSLMAGGAELEQLSHELQGLAADPATSTDPELAEVAKELAAEVKETA